MNEEVKRVVDALKLPVWGEAVRVVNDRLSTAALFIENLAAENERLTARCEAAEKDMKLIADNMDGCTYILPCGLCAKNNKRCDVSDTCFEWRGPREGETE